MLESLQWAAPPELTTALTNLINTAVCLVLVFAMGRLVRPRLRVRIWGLAFCLLAAVSLLGFIVHGIVLPQETVLSIWRYLNGLLACMLSAYSAAIWYETRGPGVLRRVIPAYLLASAAFLVLIWGFRARLGLTFTPLLAFCGANQLVVLILLLSSLRRKPWMGWFFLGVLVLLAASVVQVTQSLRVNIGVELDNNGLYHLLILVFTLLHYRGILAASRQENGETL